MPSINIRQLRDTRRLKAWLQAGKTVELRERDRLIARIVPANGEQPPAEWPDFAARAKEIFGDRVLPNMVLEEKKAVALLSIYLDSSFLVSLYLNDANSGPARRRISGQHRLWLTPLHRAEWAHAVARAEFRGLISDHDARRLYSDFMADRERGLWAEAATPEMSFERCIQLAQQHGTRMGLTTLDTLHVASALELGAERFWTFDERQAKLARAVGLKA